MAPFYEEDNTEGVVVGLIQRKLLHKGSLHEHEGFVIFDERGWVRFEIRESKHFTQDEVTIYEGKKVQVSGIWNLGVLYCSSKDILQIEAMNTTQENTGEGEAESQSINCTNSIDSTEDYNVTHTPRGIDEGDE